jgi:hypothetical protein
MPIREEKVSRKRDMRIFLPFLSAHSPVESLPFWVGSCYASRMYLPRPEVLMKTKRQAIYLGDSKEAVLRVVCNHNTNLELGIETGVVSHRRNAVAVWRPANAFGLGLDHGWRDGRWRNLYETTVAVAPPEQDGIYDHGLVDIGGVRVKLPIARLTETRALHRFLLQQSR